jgi:signal transduction histidine kinase
VTSDAERAWLDVLQQVAGRSAHEVKGALNGVSLSLEVVRSRSAAGKTADVADFAASAADHLEIVTARVEALLYLAREAKPPAPADVSLILRHLAALLQPAAQSDGGSLTVEGLKESALTSAPPAATRLALAAGMLAHIKEGEKTPVRCTLKGGVEPVVRFSHQSASAPTGSLGPVVMKAIAADGIRVQESDGELTLVFPKYQ